MKKIYLTPQTEIVFAEVENMLAESIAIISDTTVDGSEALTKEDNTWNIWGE